MGKVRNDYVIITPIKNEELYISKTLDSVTNQTILPSEWIIVNDGSTDKSIQIIQEYIQKHSFIRIIENTTISYVRSGGSKVVQLFNIGYKNISYDNWNFIVKLDADVSLPPNYFEKIISILNRFSNVGLAGGKLFNFVNGKLTYEQVADYHVRGAFKCYKRDCFEDIGGLREIHGWDGFDEILLMYNGWTTYTDSSLHVIHYKYTGSGDGQFITCRKIGNVLYNFGYDFILLSLKVLKTAFTRKPYIVSGLYVYFGFFESYITKKNNIIDKEYRVFFKKMQYKRIFNAKNKIFRKFNNLLKSN